MNPKLNITIKLFENLEPRVLLSGFKGYTPSQIRHAYGIDQISFQTTVMKRIGRGNYIPVQKNVAGDGTGQTIAIVNAFRPIDIKGDLATFSKKYKLPMTDGYGKPVLTIAQPQGKPPVNGAWATETAMDVEWAHAIAPRAHILLVQAISDSTDDLLTAIDYARNQPGVVAISLSWGGSGSPFDTSNNTFLTTPAGHIGGSGYANSGIAFVTSSGDEGVVSAWPASSPNVITVGGTTLTLDSRNNIKTEVAWSGTGGGANAGDHDMTADVAYSGDPNIGFSVFCSTPDSGYVGWQTLAGTSGGTPQWAGLIAIADQGRAYQGKVSLDTATQLHQLIYDLPDEDFNDIITGSNAAFSASVGVDKLTGRGTPRAVSLIRDLVGY